MRIAKRYFGIDFGGTNLRIGEVDPLEGRIVRDSFCFDSANISNNTDLTRIVCDKIPKGCNVGICAAGEVDEEGLIIKFSPHSKIKGEPITFGRDLQLAKKCQVVLVNDMKAAVLAVTKYGEGKKFSNVVLASYSSGFNCALSRDRKISSQAAEFGHLPYKLDGDLYCGCGGKGHLETYVSGNGASLMAQQYFRITNISNHIILQLALQDCYKKKEFQEGNPAESGFTDPHLFFKVVAAIRAEHVYRSYRLEPTKEPQKSIHRTQVKAIADSFGMISSAYNPLDCILVTGGQTKDWKVLFLPAIQRFQEEILQLSSLPKPRIERTLLQDAGMIGAVAYYLYKKE